MQTPQSLVIELSLSNGTGKKTATTPKAYVGWTGMPSTMAGVTQQVRVGGSFGDRVEMDPQFAAMLGPGYNEGSQVRASCCRVLEPRAGLTYRSGVY